MFNSLIFLRLNFELSIFFCNFVVSEVNRDFADGRVPCPQKKSGFRPSRVTEPDKL